MQNRKLFVYCGITATLSPAACYTFALLNEQFILRQNYIQNAYTYAFDNKLLK